MNDFTSGDLTEDLNGILPPGRAGCCERFFSCRLLGAGLIAIATVAHAIGAPASIEMQPSLAAFPPGTVDYVLAGQDAARIGKPDPLALQPSVPESIEGISRQERMAGTIKLAQGPGMCWSETATGLSGSRWRPCDYNNNTPSTSSSGSSSGSSNSYRQPQPSGRNNAAAAAATAGAVGALLQLLGDINSGTKGSQADYDDAQREIDRLSAEELRRYNEQLRQAEELNKRLQEGAPGEGDGSGNPFASTVPAGSVEDNPFAANAQSTASTATAPPNGTNPFGKTAAKPKDPTQNYAGRSCAYFTAAPDAAHLNTYADGANVCYGDKMYVCEGRSWRYLGPCSAFAGGKSRQADKLEKTRFNTKIYEDE